MSTYETASTGSTGSSHAPRYRRKLRNYLIDVRLQVRYTAFIIAVAVLVTAFLGWKIYDASQDTSKVILMTGLVDPGAASELQAQFRSNDRIILFGIVGFGVLVVLAVITVGIWITHKVAGPLFSIEGICARVRDNKLAPSLRQHLRRGDELKQFYATFRDMYEALRVRAGQDVQVLSEAINRIEESGGPRETIEALKRLRQEKQASLEPPDNSGSLV
jgi:hypothetical protein